MFCLTKVDQHQQRCQQHVQGLILGVYQFPGIIEASWHDLDVQLYVFDHADLIGTGYITVRCTPTPRTIPTTWSRATSRCNSAPWHCRSLILVARYMFLTMQSWLEQVSEFLNVHQRQEQRQQHGTELLQGVTQLPGIVEGWSWCPDICFWPCWVYWNRLQNHPMYTNTINNANNMV